MKEPIRRKAAFSLALILLFVSTFALMTAAVGSLVTTNINNVNKEGVNKRSRYVAYAAIQMALQRLNQDRFWDPGDVYSNVTMPGCDPKVTFNLKVYNNWGGGFSNPAPDGTFVPQYMVYIKADADLARMRSARTTAGIASMGYIGDSYFNYAATGTNLLSLTNNSVTDSYVWALAGPPHHQTLQKVMSDKNGNIITNGTDAAITLSNSTCKGNATVGPNADLATAIVYAGTGQILPPSVAKINTGLKRVPRYVPPFDPTTATGWVDHTGGSYSLSPGGYANMTLNSATMTLSAGNYYFAQTVSVNASNLNVDSTVTRDNPVSVYVGTGVTLTGSNVNLPLARDTQAGPMTLRFFFVGNGSPGMNDLKFDMNGSEGGFVAAGKGMHATLKDSTVWGSMKGYNITLSNATVNYDRSLFNYLNMGTVAWNLQGLVTDSGDTLDADGMGG